MMISPNCAGVPSLTPLKMAVGLSREPEGCTAMSTRPAVSFFTSAANCMVFCVWKFSGE